MKLDLILDTSRKGVALGIYRGEKVLCEIFNPDCRGENLGKIFDESLERIGASAEEIGRVLVTLGPGSFTGLRTGIAFCEGLCLSGERALYGVSTLRALLSLSADSHVASILFARNGFLYVGTSAGEWFLPVEEAFRHLDSLGIRSFVIDRRVAEDPASREFFNREGVSSVIAEGNEIAPFRRFFDEISPSPIQRANYIQPSYYERRGAMGVVRQ